MKDRAAIAHSAGKPIIMEEYGMMVRVTLCSIHEVYQ